MVLGRSHPCYLFFFRVQQHLTTLLLPLLSFHRVSFPTVTTLHTSRWHITPLAGRSCCICRVKKNVTVSKSLEELAREVARVLGQPGWQRGGSESSDESGPLLVPLSARVVSGRLYHRFAITDRSFDVSRWKFGKVAPGAMSCENPRSTTLFI